MRVGSARWFSFVGGYCGRTRQVNLPFLCQLWTLSRMEARTLMLWRVDAPFVR